MLFFFFLLVSFYHFYTSENSSSARKSGVFMGLVSASRICDAATIHCLLEQELAHAVNACSHALNKANPRFPEVRS